MSGLAALQKTSGAKWVIVLRVLAGAPLAFFGFMHLIGMMPMRPLVEAAGMPAPAITAIAASAAQFLGGVLLLSGAFTRLGALMALGTMAGAVFTHVKVPDDQWPDPENPGQVMQEPVFLMYVAIAIILMSLVMLATGGGKWSVDDKKTSSSSPGNAPAGGGDGPLA